MRTIIADIVEVPRVMNHLEVLFWPLVISLIVIALVRLRSPKTLFAIFKIAGNNAHLHLYLREGFNVNGISSYLLQLNYFLVFGILSYCIYDHWSQSSEIDYLILLVCLLAPWLYFVVKYIVIKIFAFLTDTEQGFFEYLINYKVFYQAQGILLLPFTIALIFSSFEQQYYLALIAISVFVLIGVIRTVLSFLYAIRYGFSVLYIFLYLCTLEILPLVVIFKLFNDRIL
ncbi:MAG: DUF4271 domain-containing protein [Crocinitomicaceae bacterium]|nr:DUF4271 domain-containing protein [Crocinitomicaceae bacterium]